MNHVVDSSASSLDKTRMEEEDLSPTLLSDSNMSSIFFTSGLGYGQSALQSSRRLDDQDDSATGVDTILIDEDDNYDIDQEDVEGDDCNDTMALDDDDDDDDEENDDDTDVDDDEDDVHERHRRHYQQQQHHHHQLQFAGKTSDTGNSIQLSQNRDCAASASAAAAHARAAAAATLSYFRQTSSSGKSNAGHDRNNNDYKDHNNNNNNNNNNSSSNRRKALARSFNQVDEDDFNSQCLDRLDSLMLSEPIVRQAADKSEIDFFDFDDDDTVDLALPRTSTHLPPIEDMDLPPHNNTDSTGSTASTVLLNSVESDSPTPKKRRSSSARMSMSPGGAGVGGGCPSLAANNPCRAIPSIRFPPALTNSKLPCTECRSTFTSNLELHRHLSTNHPHLRQRFYCELCGIGYTKKEQLQRHRERHQNEAHKCEVCGKRFKRADHLRAHQRAMHTTGEFGCHLCARTFGKAEALKKHMEKHETKSKPAGTPCEHCGRVFARKGNLVQHARRCGSKTAAEAAAAAAAAMIEEATNH